MVHLDQMIGFLNSEDFLKLQNATTSFMYLTSLMWLPGLSKYDFRTTYELTAEQKHQIVSYISELGILYIKTYLLVTGDSDNKFRQK